MPLHFATQPELIRANQKDQYYLESLGATATDALLKCLGPERVIKWKDKLDTVVNLIYYGFTTLAGLQTLGEEYLSIIQVNSNNPTRVPSRWRRLGLVLLLGLDRGLLASSNGLIQSVLKRWIEDDQILSDSSSLVRSVLQVLIRVHVGWFYLQGEFLSWTKRVLGIRYVAYRQEPLGPSPIFKVLGVLAVLQVLLSVRELVVQLSQLRSSLQKEPASLGPSTIVCPLCLDSCRHSTCTPCGHLFCWQCIHQWMESSESCPSCRANLSPSGLVILKNLS